MCILLYRDDVLGVHIYYSYHSRGRSEIKSREARIYNAQCTQFVFVISHFQVFVEDVCMVQAVMRIVTRKRATETSRGVSSVTEGIKEKMQVGHHRRYYLDPRPPEKKENARQNQNQIPKLKSTMMLAKDVSFVRTPHTQQKSGPPPHNRP